MILILGSGLAGLSASYHIGHERCLLLEAGAVPFGHIASDRRNGFTWDEGPHVSFTSDSYVQELFAKSVGGAYEEYPVTSINHYYGSWIHHPAQSNLYQVPEGLRKACLESFLARRNDAAVRKISNIPQNYDEWLRIGLGDAFVDAFSRVYTRKYWTTEPHQLTTDWIGSRVYWPKIEDVVKGAKGPLQEQTHYIRSVRYPTRGGFQSFGEVLLKGANVHLRQKAVKIDLKARKVWTADGQMHHYRQLINTIPLPEFVAMTQQATSESRDAASVLRCSELLLVNVSAAHLTQRPEHWTYVYDEDKLSTRINCTERLSPNNAPSGETGIQVEVYASPYRPFEHSDDEMARRVVRELMALKLLRNDARNVQWHTRRVSYANVIFDHQRRAAMNTILDWLSEYGLVRESDDLAATTDWAKGDSVGNKTVKPRIHLAGRFGQWKYFWTDDCVLRGRQIAEMCRV